MAATGSVARVELERSPDLRVGRTLALSRCGRYIAVCDAGRLRIIDASGSDPVDIEAVALDFAWVVDRLWVTSPERLRVFDPRGDELAAVGLAGEGYLAAVGAGAVAVGNQLARFESGRLSLEGLGELEGETIVGYLGGVRTLRARGRLLRVVDPGREIGRLQLPEGGEVIGAIEIFEGAAVAVVSAVDGGRTVDVVKLRGGLVNHIELPGARDVAIAAAAGKALATTGSGDLIIVDLRLGVAGKPLTAPIAGCHVDIDEGANHVAVAGPPRPSSGGRRPVFRLAFRDLFAGVTLEVATPAPSPVSVESAEAVPPGFSETVAPPRPEIPSGPLVALMPPAPPRPAAPQPDAMPYTNPEEHLGELVSLACARAARALTAASSDGDGGTWSQELERRIADRVAATLAAGASLPLCDLAAELELDPGAIDILVTVAAPALSTEAARLHRDLASDPQRSLCDRGLVGETLGVGADRLLAPHGALIASGLIEETPAASPLFAPLAVAEPVFDRLRGMVAGERPGAITAIVSPHYSLEEIPIDRQAVIALVRHLQSTPARPVRVAVRGRPGLGRIQLLAAVAARAGRSLAVIDAERLPDGAALPDTLRCELVRARLWGALPCVTGLADRDRHGDERWRSHLREVFRTFAGPIAFATGADFELPLDPGYFSITLPALSESARLAHWRSRITDAGLEATGAEVLARRTRLGPAAIDAVVTEVAARGVTGDATGELATAARQRIDARLGAIATRVERLARWDQLALADDTLGAVRELIARSRHRRTVFDDWGFDGAVTSSRGLTALFSGPPGTGKTLVAGVIARELGLDLYRVDLASLVSKWIGETEKNLARLFDAAEDSQAVLLFDEADTLFSRRTDVKTSNDRHANMETGYLLQRLDAFEGVAILTTNLNKSIDPAVARRLSMRILFDFPDDKTRVALWKAHLPADLPVAGELDLEAVARDYPMTGGYVRNCAVRAAFLAADDGVALTRDHLVRAIELEYQQAGRLSASGRLE